MAEQVGPIVLEDVDGVPVATAVYAQHPGRREPTVVYGGQTYAQNRMDGSRWVYRAVSDPPRVTPDTDPLLVKIVRLDPPAAPDPVCAACGRVL